MSPSAPDHEDHGLAAALAANPDARVTAILPSGQFCPMPPELGSTHGVLPGQTIFDIVPESEVPKVIGGWQRVQQYGSHAGVLTNERGEAETVLTFDARPRLGVFVMLFVPDASIGTTFVDDSRPVTSRFGTYQRDMLSAIVGMDDGARTLLGWELDEVVGRAGRDMIHPDDTANAEENWLAALVTPGSPQRWRGRHLHADGSYRWLEFTNTNRLEDLGHVVSEMMDISEEMATAQALRRRDELLARLNDALPLGVLEIDTDHRVLYANNRLHDIVGRDRRDDLADQFGELAADDRDRLRGAIDATLTAGTDVDLEVRFEGGDVGGERIASLAVRALRESGRITGAVLCVSDITEASTLRRELERQATFDRLTGCFNRSATIAALEAALADGDGSTGTAVLFLDLDRFKPVNDELGHAAGDHLLAVIAARLRSVVRGDDVVGRIGGDEFLVVCPRTDRDSVDALSRRITAVVAEPVALDDVMVQIGTSLGVAWSADRSVTADSLVADADAAMYEAKRTVSDRAAADPSPSRR